MPGPVLESRSCDVHVGEGVICEGIGFRWLYTLLPLMLALVLTSQTQAAKHKMPALEPMFWGTFKHQLLLDKTINPLGDCIYMPVLWIVFREASLLWVLVIQ